MACAARMVFSSTPISSLYVQMKTSTAGTPVPRLRSMASPASAWAWLSRRRESICIDSRV
ncbi:Uncharacterised protein [Mycobacterium tuberculosis]|nr:Uncharacterised protein [Mycobacterium tuberculosis]